MEEIKIKEDLDWDILKELGYKYNMIEGGFISEDFSTIIFISRSPYEREVADFLPNREEQHKANVEKLISIGAIEDSSNL